MSTPNQILRQAFIDTITSNVYKLNNAILVRLALKNITENIEADKINKQPDITAEVHTKISYNKDGVVIGGTDATQDDIADGTTYKQYSATDKTKLAGIEALAQVNIQPDYTQTNNALKDFIKNKPILPATLTEVAGKYFTSFNETTGVFVAKTPKFTELDFTSANLSSLATKSHTVLTDIGTNTHAQIDTFIGTTVPGTYFRKDGGVITGNTHVEPASDSNDAFHVKNVGGTKILQVDTDEDKITVNGWSKLGDDANTPKIKTKVLTAHIDANAAGSEQHSHGIADYTKIISATILIEDTNGLLIPPHSIIANSLYYYFIDGTSVTLTSGADSLSTNVLDMTGTIYLTYIE